MTNKISKAREALDTLLKFALHEAKSEQDLFANDEYQLLEEFFSTLSSIDAERLGKALAHEEQYNEIHRHDEETILHAAATLHGLVRGE